MTLQPVRLSVPSSAEPTSGRHSSAATPTGSVAASRCATAYWAHHSWLEAPRPVRNERSARAAHAFLFERYPQLADVTRAAASSGLPVWPRPACARLCRVVAALALGRSLRRVVAAQSHTAFAASVAPRLLEAIQRHPRALAPDLHVEPAASPFDRHAMTALGLALVQRADADLSHAFWWSLRLPREIAQSAQRYGVRGLSAADAADLLADAKRLMEVPRC
ncbi:hypothetical protein [Paraburkholderia sp. BL21I4N1]|uniref:hypothetical protein n=1 Tax=Paraburkholderia sp. BL21I4N1 TaxID=1938801 RepID=UPI000D45266E|nr:hypothetical protein [Paraburkholderia sp. BL21I4N1]PQV44274.1 hypothetical protein B0G83_12523 [Paraburkholderia sp. BL21I4N1]